uniref:TSA: Wollemia nobilis Ref_Wollemi_Transcript_22135_2382 transcribed RNA sequence n=1 Tax=Wollemia nobilis TaxID=56998 RepID=A0A0C9S4Y1_9CONI
MGGREDDEPPLKRIKVSSAEARRVPEKQAPIPSLGSFDTLMAEPLPSQQGETVGSKGLIRRVEFVRIITQALYSLGYQDAGDVLEKESRLPLESDIVKLFKQQIRDGKWDQSVITLQQIGQVDADTLRAATFLILQQKFFEFLVDKVNLLAALETLRLEISPLRINTQRVHELASCIVSPSRCELLGYRKQGNGDSSHRMKLLQDIQQLLPPSIMIPEKRLESLVEQALSVQREACVFHNSLDNALSLYTDHQCGRDQIPTMTLQVLQSHENEVWFLQFSNNGKYLASASKDCTAIIWEVSENGTVSMKHRLTGHRKPVSFVSWSPDDKMLLTCGIEEYVKLWNVETGELKLTYDKCGNGFTSCGWFPDGARIICGDVGKSIYIWDLEGKELDSWQGPRMPKISDLAVTSDGKQIISTCGEKEIMMFNLDTKSERLIDEEKLITSVCVSKDSRFLLVNLVNQEIHLWDITGDDSKLLLKYKGHKQGRYVIRSCFGGSDHAFIVSGSEDSQVYIWHRGNGQLLAVLPGHSGTVNCVSWNPVNPHMFASASDDYTIRIWGVDRNILKNKNANSSNGVVHFANGRP